MDSDSLQRRVREVVDLYYNGSVNKAARDMGVPQPTLTQIVDGTVQNPRGSTLQKIAAHSGASVDWLLTGKGRGPDPAAREWSGGEAGRRWQALVESLGLEESTARQVSNLPIATRNAARSMPLRLLARDDFPEEIFDKIVKQQAALERAQELEKEAWIAVLSAWIDAFGIEVVREALERPDVMKAVTGGFREHWHMPDRFDPDPYGVEAHRKGAKPTKSKSAKRRKPRD